MNRVAGVRSHGRPSTSRAPRDAVAVALAALLLLITMVGVAWADDATTETTVAAADTAEEEAPALDYTFTWPTFIITFALVIGYYVFLFRMSEKEFKGVVAERFGPGRSKGGAA